ncbi:MAG: UDP-2,3-diacylglucosamine diphosphatase [Hydrotalea flava]|uniref:UDP-2,3-diacylglucosamine diphosphatase n=1 Tax=Hydrotalea TaxID=1004300 RepID=UPI000941FE42|nr:MULTISPECIES: UDP-2,3-diacylglucosamine diphosphatase [Hydrotalea]MBY0347779.1 UDP-2,3-diacylglucosamine diphosphatase [Hydrotalea flava]NIM33969.1 UDP-2,3-diacylglucosamine diphosphatase [Hydrotalea flava]NIM36798.1 UDP-2,3-diacylglucosamine diphosphatase [Hydrotalea flava]NIN01983.1 UDP-2,3-diacylglucosamine diphosphatase [Hydrotalea flava]NIN13642.1 UDP-2,3-diacylglucosamine diphosphatase [Hydrotalea flava]
MNDFPNKKIFFLSDFHLGAPDYNSSLIREKKIVAFLNSIQAQAAQIFIMGDIFDFWYEYKTVVPKGYTRLLGKLAELTDADIPVHVFVGNHDMWMKDYFQKELNIPVYFEPKVYEWNGKSFYIGHGDGLGPGDYGYKFIKKIFRNRLCQWLFGQLHPTWGIGLANYLSRKSRAKTGSSEDHFLGEESEWLIVYAKELLTERHYDYFIFGHRHFPIDYALNENSRYINLGDWIQYSTYAVFDGATVALKKWE